MASTRRKPGQLGPQVEGYRAWLAYRGYTSQTVRNMLADLGRLGRWMSGEGLVPAQLDEDAMAAFVGAGPAAGRRRALGPRAMMPLLSYLREGRHHPGSEAAADSSGGAARGVPDVAGPGTGPGCGHGAAL